MICSLSADDKHFSVYLYLYEYLASYLNRIMKKPDAPINACEMIKKMYNDVV
jgi:hypothetical protein